METINLNLVPGGCPPVCNASQDDIGRTIRLNLFDGSIPYNLNGSESIKLRVRKPDGTAATIPVTSSAGSYIDLVLSDDLTDVPGKVKCKLRIDSIGAHSFYIHVENKPEGGFIWNR